VAELLEYKKTLVLYGPPGTGKTHDARTLINQIVFRYYGRKKELGRFPKCQYGEEDAATNDDFWENHVMWFQMHVNYSYDDFVIGQTFKGNETKVEKGALLKFIDSMNGTDPYFIVLDEINRVDIARVFGEVFSAMEYRGKDIDLPYYHDENDKDEKLRGKPYKLRIPENLYFIGTMNEIDFSLEHIDFALRRRFVWVRKGFDGDSLRDIIDEKIGRIDKGREKEEKTDGAKVKFEIQQADINDYIDACKSLNDKIAAEESLGEDYEIGHTFFAEVVDVLKTLREGDGGDSFEKAKRALWQISIKPTLEAYCGSMSKEDKQNFIGEDVKGNKVGGEKTCRDIFLDEKKTQDRGKQ